MDRCMDRWMDGQGVCVDGWIGGWVSDGWMHGWVHGVCVCVDGWKGELVVKWTDE